VDSIQPDVNARNPHGVQETPHVGARHLMWLALGLILTLVVGLIGLNAVGARSAGIGQGPQGLWIWGATKATPTPTKTPAPPTSTPTPMRRADVRVPTPTPSPTAVPTPVADATSEAQAKELPTPPPEVVAVAKEHGIDVSGRYIIIDQDNQRMYVVSGPVLEKEMPISSGDPERHLFTPAWVGRVGVYWGTFSARGVSADNAWHLFKAPGGNILIHGLPYTVDASGRKIYQDMDKLGVSPASRGCIRILPTDAVWFSEWGPQGVPIVVLPYTRHDN